MKYTCSECKGDVVYDDPESIAMIGDGKGVARPICDKCSCKTTFSDMPIMPANLKSVEEMAKYTRELTK